VENPVVSEGFFFVVPNIRNPLFTPRPAVSDKIAAVWKNDNRNDADQVRLALFGLGGSG